MSTAHIEAPAGTIADTVLLPGDPLRARYIAQTWLEAVEPINTVRNMLGYTGQVGTLRTCREGSPSGSCRTYWVARPARSCGWKHETVRQQIAGDHGETLSIRTHKVDSRLRAELDQGLPTGATGWRR